MLKAKRILFITHESTLSGAANLLINLLQLLKENAFCDIRIVVKRGGPQDNRFRELAPVIILKPAGYQENKNLFFKTLDFIGYRLRLRKLLRLTRECDLIFSNTIANGRLLKDLSVTGKPVVVYVHELHGAMEFCNRHLDTDLSLQYGARFFSPSMAVTKNLMSRNVAAEKIFPLNYYFPFGQVNSPVDRHLVKSRFFDAHHIPLHRFHVLGMGAAVERKGIDLFVEVCRMVCKETPGIHFTWIGGFLDKDLQQRIESDINLTGLSQHLTITGYLPHAYENMLPFDLFVLTSREDPYPLVVLEAAFARIPTIAFRDTGGIQEFIADDAGFLAEKLSVQQMAQQIIELSKHPNLLEERGEAARKKVLDWHHSRDLIIKQLSFGLEGT